VLTLPVRIAGRNEDKMDAKWQYDNNNVTYLDVFDEHDGTAGWYAASPETVEAGDAPDDGPFDAEEPAVKRAKELAIEEQERNEKLDS